MSKIKKHDEYVSHHAYVTYFNDKGMYKVKAGIYVNIEEAPASSTKSIVTYHHEVTDIELEFFVNDKKCNYVGFKELYEKLFGKDTFDSHYGKLQDEFEEHYLNNKIKVKL